MHRATRVRRKDNELRNRHDPARALEPVHTAAPAVRVRRAAAAADQATTRQAPSGAGQDLPCLAIRSLAAASSFLPSKPRLLMSAIHSSSTGADSLMNSC